MSSFPSGVEAAPALDPLCASVPLPYTAEFYPFGFPVRIASNSPVVLSAAEESWRGFGKRFSERALEVRCLVAASAATRCPPPPVFRAQRNLLITVSDRENFTCCDLRNGFAFAWVTEAAAGNTEYLRYHFIEAMTYNLLEPRYMVSLHAACVTLDGHGVLLAGNSGSGKSSLAYACARRGWIYNSDDSSALVKRGGGRTVICNPRSFRFRNTAAKLFPELCGLKARRRSNGKPTIEIPTGSLPNIRTAFESRVDYIVFLNRGDRRSGPVQLLSVSKEEAMNRLYANPWPPELNTAPEARATVERLLEAETYEMRYRDLDSAVDRLQQIVRGGAQ